MDNYENNNSLSGSESFTEIQSSIKKLNKRYRSLFIASIILYISMVGLLLILFTKMQVLEMNLNWLQKLYKEEVSSENNLQVQITPAPGISYQKYTYNPFGISFMYPKSWDITEGDGGGDGGDFIDAVRIFHQSAHLNIYQSENPNNLNPQQYFQQELQENYYSDLVVELGEFEIQGKPAFMIAQPKTCRTGAFVVALITNNDNMIIISHSELGDRPQAEELKILLENLSFDGARAENQIPPSSFFEYPPAPGNVTCSE